MVVDGFAGNQDSGTSPIHFMARRSARPTNRNVADFRHCRFCQRAGIGKGEWKNQSVDHDSDTRRAFMGVFRMHEACFQPDASQRGHVAVGATHGSQRPLVTAPKGVAATRVALAPFGATEAGCAMLRGLHPRLVAGDPSGHGPDYVAEVYQQPAFEVKFEVFRVASTMPVLNMERHTTGSGPVPAPGCTSGGPHATPFPIVRGGIDDRE